MRLSKCFIKAKTLKILYCTFVRSSLEYASAIWNPVYNKYIERIESIQRRFIKYLCFHQKIPYHSDNYHSLCRKFYLLPLSTRREITDCIQLLKILNNDIDSPDLLSKIYLNVPSKTRFNPPIRVPFSSTNYRQNSFIVRASRTFNKQCKHYDFDPFITSMAVVRRLLSLDFFKN